MNGAKKDQTYIAVIGDLVASRDHPDRGALQARLASVLTEANRRLPAVQPLEGTIGDEFQGLSPDLPAALEATLLVRLLLHPDGDVRFGVGMGGLRFAEPGRAPFGQDGPAWWAARDAVTVVAAAMGQRERPRGWRTAFLAHPSAGAEPSLAQAVNAFLVCRDEVVGRMDARDVRLLLAALEGRSQDDVAAQEGITQSAVSQRNQRSGVYALVQAQEAWAS